MKTLTTDKITRTITTRNFEYAYLTDNLEVRYEKAVAFGTAPANLPAGAKIVKSSVQTFKCSMSLERFFELCEKEVIEK